MPRPSTSTCATVPAAFTLMADAVVLRSRMSLGKSVAANVTVHAVRVAVCVGVRVAVAVLAGTLVLVTMLVPVDVAVLPPFCGVGVPVRVGGMVGSVPVAVGGTGMGVRVGRGPVL